MIETWFGPLTIEIWRLIVLFFIAGVGINIFIGIIADKCGAKGEEKIKSNFTVLHVLEVIILAPLLEELFFRGPIFWFFKGLSLTSLLMVLFWSGIIFGVPHGIIIDKNRWKILPNRIRIIKTIIVTAFLGILLGILVILTNSLLAAMILHAMLNSFAVFVSFLIIYTKKS
ncbi:MAG: CPBP family intramembrane metalloprotease [Candidatus Nealsonbacteria bacterium]|nr:CPBP family intramembrane metalloprotease [Candidatus Nealsonbacteria bacterium]